MKVVEDRYDGITIDLATLPDTEEVFLEKITALIDRTNDKKLLWVKIPIEKSTFIPHLIGLGFVFHHCDEDMLMLVKKLIENSIIPTAKNYTVGVGAVIRDGNQLLVIKDRFSTGYKLPGGHIDNNESIKQALKREVHEETGVEIEFESIANIGHFTQSQFGNSNLYIVCTARAVSKEITIHDSSEIIEAKWMEMDTFLSLEDTNNYNRRIVQAVIENKDLKLLDQPIKLRLPNSEVFF